MRAILMCVCVCGCAYGSVGETQKVYGIHHPEEAGTYAPPIDDPNGNPSNDMYETGCFIQNIFNDDGSISGILICDGSPFSVQDLIDPAPDQHGEK